MGFCIRIQNTDSDPGNIALMYSVIFPVTDNYQQQQKMVYRLSDLASVKIYLIVSAVVRKKKLPGSETAIQSLVWIRIRIKWIRIQNNFTKSVGNLRLNSRPLNRLVGNLSLVLNVFLVDLVLFSCSFSCSFYLKYPILRETLI